MEAHQCDVETEFPAASSSGAAGTGGGSNSLAKPNSRPGRSMVELQMLTGMRPGEVCILRPMDVDRRGKVWLYRPADHKTAHHGHKRVVPIGPRGQEILGPFLARPPEDYCFAPDEAQAHRNAVRRARRRTRVQPSQQNRRTPEPEEFPGDRYDPDSYRRAIEYAIAATNRAATQQAKAEGREAGENDLIPALAPAPVAAHGRDDHPPRDGSGRRPGPAGSPQPGHHRHLRRTRPGPGRRGGAETRVATG